MVSYPHFPHSYPHLLITFRYQKCVVFSTSWAAGILVNVPINVPDLRQKRTESYGFYAKLVPVKRDEIGCLRLPSSAAYVVDFDQFNRLDFDTVVTSGQPSLF